MKYMTLQAMAEACHGVYIGNPEDIKKEAISITTDSRKAEQGGVFAQSKASASMDMILFRGYWRRVRYV